MILHLSASVFSPLSLDTKLKGKLKYPDSQSLLQNPCSQFWMRTLAHSLGLEPLHLWIRALALKQTLNQNPGSEHLHTTYNPNSELSTMDQDFGLQTKELPVNGLKGFNAEKDKHESFADVTVRLPMTHARRELLKPQGYTDIPPRRAISKMNTPH